ncbi:hypothetical protein C2845_PM04G29890 [Panicum miliaceum]|uniref:Uncharacterized protein n=1 Tax=Panicum miliaceum TaxID=4540 RepID=A0A3L6QR30_PANMI|nr:hypothetical protein C2845_PM04G29890 [Panicum miliaceum]
MREERRAPKPPTQQHFFPATPPSIHGLIETGPGSRRARPQISPETETGDHRPRRCIHEPAERGGTPLHPRTTGTGRPDRHRLPRIGSRDCGPVVHRQDWRGGRWRPPASERPRVSQSGRQALSLLPLRPAARSRRHRQAEGPRSGAEAEHAQASPPQLSWPLLRALYVSLPVGVTGQACRAAAASAIIIKTRRIFTGHGCLSGCLCLGCTGP